MMIVAVLTAFQACEKPAPEPEPEDDYEATIKLNGTTVDILADADATGKLTFSVDHEWRLEIPDDVDWLTANKMSGNSTKTTVITFTAKANTGTVRTATCKIKSGSKTKKFTVRQAAQVLILKKSDIQDFDKYYKPAEFNFDMLRSDSKWSWCRSKQSEHFVVFWDKNYGEYGLYGHLCGEADTWPTTASSSSMRVDIDDLLEKAESYYDVNVNTLKFCDVGKGKSVLDTRKMEIYVLYQKEWLATGSGYDNAIGALWVNPSTCQPVGSTIAHEIGHSFQYMVYCDYLLNGGKDDSHGPGWRYGYGANGSGGCAFWEQTAQWQSYQTYKAEAFYDYYAAGYYDCLHLHVLHENPRYSNYFIHWWWVQQNDISFIGKLWRNAQYPEDPCETYMRLMGFDNAAFNDDMWKYAAHMLTFDTDEIRSYGKNYIGKTAVASSNITSSDGWYAINASKAPESCGSNSVRMTIPTSSDKTVKVTFQGVRELANCHVGPATNAGWRYGFVALGSDGTRTYSDIYSSEDEEISFTVPSNATYLWFVVSGAPKAYERHPWNDESDKDDNKWPWKAQFTNTKPYGK